MGCLKANLIETIDLGVNVPPERFVDEASATGASVIGISAMMVHTATGENGPKAVRRLLKERSLEGKIKLIVGGAPFRFDPDLAESIGADAVADNGIAAAQAVKNFLKKGAS